MFRILICGVNFLIMQLVYAANGVIETSTHRLIEVGDDIYLAQTTARLFNSNALIVVNDEDVLVVDSHITPTKGRELIRSIQTLTSKPITTLVNSHFHFDHSHGGQAFVDSTFPYDIKVQTIGHEFTRMKMAGSPLSEGTYVRGLSGNRAYVESLKEKLDQTEDKEEKKQVQIQLALISGHLKEWDEIQPVPPTNSFSDRMTLFRGSREIQLHFFGRAHTGGDVVVYFPSEKLAFTGDMMLAGPSWLGDGYVDEWVETLENLKTLDVEKIVPGHGMPFTEIHKIDLVQAFYKDLWGKTKVFFDEGVSSESASKMIDMTNHKDSLGVSRAGFDQLAIKRMYQRMSGED